MSNSKNYSKDRSGFFHNIHFIITNGWKWDKKLFVYIGLFTISSASAPFLNIFTSKFIIDELTGMRRTNYLACIVLGFLITSSLVNYFNAYSEGIFSPSLIRIKANFEMLIYEKIMKMDFKYTEDPKVLDDIETSDRAIASIGLVLRKLFFLFGEIIAFLGYMTIVVTLSPWVLIYLIFTVGIIYWFVRRANKYEYSRKDNIAKVNRKSKYIYNLMYNFAYGKDIRIFDLSQWISGKFQEINKAEIKIQKDIKRKYFKADIMDAILLLTREGIIYGYLIYMVLYKNMSIGNFTMYCATIAGFASWMQKVLDNIVYINNQNLYINEFRNFLVKNLEGEETNHVDIPRADSYEIEFRNVSFKYPNSERYIYKNLSLKIKWGERLAIVGVNGAGKTTFVKLLTRLYEPTEGEILINGINISKFDKNEYYKLFSVVFQEIKMFAFSVAENVSLKTKDRIDRDKVLQSIGRAGIGKKINSLEKGIDTSLLKILDSSGIELSGGENQRLAIARILYKNGNIIILDEPTSALYPIAEYNLYKSFDDMIQNKTAIYISHRLASKRFCDNIALFEDGEIKEYGTHEELLINNGSYAKMFNTQASYYKEEVSSEEGA